MAPLLSSPSHVVHQQVLSVSLQNLHSPSPSPILVASSLCRRPLLPQLAPRLRLCLSSFRSMPSSQSDVRNRKIRSCHSPAQNPLVRQRVPTALQRKPTLPPWDQGPSCPGPSLSVHCLLPTPRPTCLHHKPAKLMCVSGPLHLLCLLQRTYAGFFDDSFLRFQFRFHILRVSFLDHLANTPLPSFTFLEKM